MLTSLALVAAISAPANAEAVEQTVVANPFALTWPAFDGRYEKKLDKKQGAYGRVAAGKFNPLLLRLGAALANSATNEEVSFGGTIFGVGGGYNYYFKSFKKGWYANANLEITRTAAVFTVGNDSATVTSSSMTVGPQLGWKKVGDSGFTFQWEIGAGYTAVLGDPKVEVQAGGSTALDEQVNSQGSNGVGLTGGFNLGYSF